MLDHIGLNVVDYDRSKAFYERPLSPRGPSLLTAGATTHRLRRFPARGRGFARMRASPGVRTVGAIRFPGGGGPDARRSRCAG